MPIEPDIIVFGGSFDPPHQGHVDCLRHAVQRFPSAEFIVVPSAFPATTKNQSKQVEATFEQRLMMCELAFKKFLTSNHNNFQISQLEAGHEQPHYTIKTLQTIAQQHPEKTIGLLIGLDQMLQFSKWHSSAQILQTTSIIAIPRRQKSEETGVLSEKFGKQALLAKISQEICSLGLKVSVRSYGLDISEFGTHVFLNPEAETSLAESREIRSAYATSVTQPHDSWLDIEVQEFIQKNQLYSR